MAKDDHWKRTELVEGGRRKEWRSRLVNVPVHRASTLLFDRIEDLEAARPGLGDYCYGLQGTPTQWALSEALTALEPGAAGTVLYPTGLAALAAALLTVLKTGDELLVTDTIYGPTRKVCDTTLKRFGVSTRYFDPLSSSEEIAAMASERTAAILLESPGTVTMEVMDVPGICAVAKDRGIVTILDNTWATPLLFPAIAAGVDISIMAATKFVAGHSDVMAGCATANETHYDRLARSSWDLGYALAPDDAWLASRGLRTMAVRMKYQEQSTLEIARWLDGRERVGRLLHPAFPSCPGHDVWKRDFDGSSSVFSFEFLGSRTERTAFINRLQQFGIGFSWGGFESLVVSGDQTRSVSEPPAKNIVRLQIGLEETADLIADLEQALGSVG